MAAEIKPLKKFGQNFLNNTFYSKKIVEALECQEKDILLEIGAGTGALTDILIKQKFNRLTVLEIDIRLTDLLQQKYGSRISVLNKSILDFSFDELSKNSRIKVIGNIPYNITSDIILKIIENHAFIKRAVIMVQKEVADRLVAETRTKDYGILTVFIKCHGEIYRVLDVSRDNFYPVPNVDSAVISFDLFEKIDGIADYNLFRKVVRICFNNRRKMLRNSLKKILDNQNINEIRSVQLDHRPEELTVQDFKTLSNEISEINLN